MDKFKPGEIAILDLSSRDPTKFLAEGHPPDGSECELIEWKASPSGWVCHSPGHPNPRWSDGTWCIPERMLRKRRPPEQPAEDWFIEDLNRMLGRRPVVDVDKVKEALLKIPFPRH